MKKEAKITQLQVRVMPNEKEAIRRLAIRAGMGMSQWLLSRALPGDLMRFQQLLKQLAATQDKSYVLAEVHDLLQSVSASELERMVSEPPPVMLTPYWGNYVAAMVEYAANQKGIRAPSWTSEIKPLDDPVFGSDIASLRFYLLSHSPPCFRNRNIFVDATIGQRV
jgi:hypothetical protein